MLQSEKLKPATKKTLVKALQTPLILKKDAPSVGHDFSVIEDDGGLWALMEQWQQNKVGVVAVDLEFEASLHYPDLNQICTVQIYDNNRYYIVDGIKLTRSGLVANAGTSKRRKEEKEGALKAFLESRDIKKLMFSCSNDGAIVKKQGYTLNNVYDVQRLGSLTAARGLSLVTFISLFLGLNIEDGKAVESHKGSDDALASEMKEHKKKCQMFDWTRRPVPPKQVAYALGDVEYLFSLREALLNEIGRGGRGKSELVAYAEKIAAYDNGEYVVAKPKCDLDFAAEYGALKQQRAQKAAKVVYTQATLVAKDSLRRFTEFLPLEGVVGLGKKISEGDVEVMTVEDVAQFFTTKEPAMAATLLEKLKSLSRTSKTQSATAKAAAKEARKIIKVKTTKVTTTAIQKAKAKVIERDSQRHFSGAGFSKKAVPATAALPTAVMGTKGRERRRKVWSKKKAATDAPVPKKKARHN